MLKQISILLCLLLSRQAYCSNKALTKQTKSLISSQKKINELSKSYKENLSRYYELRKKIALSKAYQRWLRDDISELDESITKLSLSRAELEALRIDSIDILTQFTASIGDEPTKELASYISQLTTELSSARNLSSEQIVINEDEKVIQITIGNLARFAVNPKKENCYAFKLGRWEPLKGKERTQLLLAYKKIKDQRINSLTSFPIEVKK